MVEKPLFVLLQVAGALFFSAAASRASHPLTSAEPERECTVDSAPGLRKAEDRILCLTFRSFRRFQGTTETSFSQLALTSSPGICNRLTSPSSNCIITAYFAPCRCESASMGRPTVLVKIRSLLSVCAVRTLNVVSHTRWRYFALGSKVILWARVSDSIFLYV